VKQSTGYYALIYRHMSKPDSKRIADKIAESVSEDPEIEPGQADKTPATETEQEQDEDRQKDR
jgi:hypothetical protein